MKNDIVDQIIHKFKGLLGEDVANRLASESGLVKRTGKLIPCAFLIVMVVEMSLIGTHSQSMMCVLLQQYGCALMTPQALSQRLGDISTVKFLKSAYFQVIKDRLSRINFQVQSQGILGRFQNTYLEDSTSCQLNQKASGEFKGSGGGGSTAGYKIHTIWDVSKNCVKDFHVTPSSVSDQSQAFNIIDHLEPEDLVLRDLGYFSIPCFRQVADALAYFLSRLRSAVKVYTLEGVLIDDLGRYVEERLAGRVVMELEVLIGMKEQFPVRLIVGRVSQGVYDQRVRNLRRKYRGNGKTPSKSLLNFNKFTWFVTNIPKELLSDEEAFTLYKLRWEIELVFKCFKSNFNVDIIKGSSKNRIQCFILAKLLAILTTSVFFAYVSQHAITLYQRELSFTKFTQWILIQKYLILLFRPEVLNYKVMQMLNMNILSLCKQKRSRRTSKELLKEEATYSDIYPQTSEMQPLALLA